MNDILAALALVIARQQLDIERLRAELVQARQSDGGDGITP